jgi:polyisoprenoid-binding protein YceI
MLQSRPARRPFRNQRTGELVAQRVASSAFGHTHPIEPNRTRRTHRMRRMTALTALVLAAAVGTVSAQETFTIDTVHSNVSFRVRHLIAKTGGEFNAFTGTIVADFEKLDASSVEFVIDASSIDTRNADRDAHLRSPDFFDVEKFPQITFKSSKITKISDTTYAVTGTLTMRGVSKEVTLEVEHLGQMEAMGGVRHGFELSTTVNRKDYGIVWNRALDAGGFLLGDDVEISIDISAVKKQDEAKS